MCITATGRRGTFTCVNIMPEKPKNKVGISFSVMKCTTDGRGGLFIYVKWKTGLDLLIIIFYL